MENKDNWDIARLISWITSYFKEKKLDNPRLAAELILCDILGKDRVYLYTNFDQPLSEEELAELRKNVKRRASYEPVAYIIGERSFFEFDFKVNKDVLIPRPDTEILLESALKYLREKSSPFVLDLGTGSGILAVSIAASISDSKVIASDISYPSLKIARQNAFLFASDRNISFLLSSWFDSIKQSCKFDLIVSNPPYIKSCAIKELQPEVRMYEPMHALDGGDDGLDAYKSILSSVAFYLKDDGLLMMEIGFDQAGDLEKLCSESNSLELLEILKDYGGRDRVVIIRKNS